MTARWYLGAGLIALTLIMAAIDRAGAEIWVIAAAGAVILAHAFGMQMWDMGDSTVALLVDITAIGIAAMFIGSATDSYLPASLTFVGTATLISLFTEHRIRALILTYMAILTLASMLAMRDWDLLEIADEFLASTFVVILVSTVISAIRNRLVEVEAARAQTIGVVSHELRNHLTGVIGAVELINDDESRLGPNETNELLQLALQQSVEAEEVIEDLLIASRAERGVLDAMPEPVDLCPLTETVIRRTSVESSDIVYDFSHGPVRAMADPLRYKQIVRNLLTNAQRYGGDTIRVSIERVDGVVSVAVADDGEGVDPSDVSSLFQAYRGGKASHGVSGSTGLGLWIARSLAQKMDGALIYERRSGLTVFELTLPAAPPEATSDTAEEPALSSSRS
ncbi:MAG: sensor histidine kinase [Actinomycetota bacterium]